LGHYFRLGDFRSIYSPRFFRPAKADRIKEALGWLKVVFAALVAVDVALIAWLAQNFQGAENVLVILALVAVVFTTGAIVGVNHAAYRRISELENL
jgi:4-hydroxybenzoate polyprenyltransferase